MMWDPWESVFGDQSLRWKSAACAGASLGSAVTLDVHRSDTQSTSSQAHARLLAPKGTQAPPTEEGESGAEAAAKGQRFVLERMATHMRAAAMCAAQAWESGISLHTQGGYTIGTFPPSGDTVVYCHSRHASECPPFHFSIRRK